MNKMRCTNCGRRAFDISALPKEEVEVNLKCPQCGKVVSVPCNVCFVMEECAVYNANSSKGKGSIRSP